MKSYPAAERAFKIGSKQYVMKMLTMGLQARIENEDTVVTLIDVVKDCTSMSFDDLDELHIDQFKAIYDDVIAFSYSNKTEDGEVKKQ